MNDISERIAALSSEKRQLLLQRLNSKKEEVFSQRQIKPVPRDTNSFPLSFAQQRLWFLDQLQPSNVAYNFSQTMHLTGWLNIIALEQSFQEIVKRHEILRTTFTQVDGQPMQIIAPNMTLTKSIIDLEELPPDVPEIEILQLVDQKIQQPFDLSKDCLLRVTLVRLSQTKHILLLTMHHIVSDGWSMGVFISELKTLYEAFKREQSLPLPELPIQYVDYAVWQRQCLHKEVLEDQLNYWKKQLNQLPILQLKSDRSRLALQTFQGARHYMVLPKALSEKLKTLHQRQGITLFMILLAAFATLLHWYTGQEDIVVGTDVANRNQAETKELIGFFTNQLVLRTDLSGNPTFQEFLLRVREVTLAAYANQDVSFDMVVNVLNPKRDLGRTPLFQVKLVMENTPTPSLEFSDLTISPLNIERKAVQFDLLVELMETKEGLLGLWEYNTDLFDTATITRINNNFETLLDNIATQPEAKLSELKDILTQVEQQQRLATEKAYQNAIQQNLLKLRRNPK